MATASPTRPPVFNLPNQLTAARLVLAVVLFVLITAQSWAWCVVVFAVAAVTDYLDGYLALWDEDMTFQTPVHDEPLVGKPAYEELVRQSAQFVKPLAFDCM